MTPLENQTPAGTGEGSGDQDSCQAIEVSQSTKSVAEFPAGNANNFQLVGDVAARVVRDLGRRIGVEYVP